MSPVLFKRRGKSQPPFAIRPADEAILRALHRYHYLTSVQLCRLLYTPTSLTYVRDRLRPLAEAGIVQRSLIPTIRGKPPATFSLGTTGRNYLAELGRPVPKRFRPSEAQESYLYLTHTQQLNDFLIGLDRTLTRWPDVLRWEMTHERDLKRHPIRLTVPAAAGAEAATIKLEPDAWLTLTYRSGKHRCIAVELDRGTEEQKKWRAKIRNYLTFHETSYQEQYPHTPLTVAVVNTLSPKRGEDLRRWTQAELEVIGQRKKGFLFRFGYLSPSAQAQDVALEPSWYRPYAAKPLALVPIRQAPAFEHNGSGQPLAEEFG